MREYFWVCDGCGLWEVHLGNAPLLYVGMDVHNALVELIDEHKSGGCPTWPDHYVRPVDVPTLAFRSVG